MIAVYRPRPKVSALPALLIVAGIALVLVAVAWRGLEAPTRSEGRMARAVCYMNHPGDDDRCEDAGPQAPTFGPVVTAAAGTFLLLLGVILVAGQGKERVVYVNRPHSGYPPPRP